MHDNNDILGKIVKEARQKKQLTIEALANRLGISERYVYRIENENCKPKYELLRKLIRTLDIDPDTIFYPEKSKPCSNDSRVEEVIRMLYSCDKSELKIIKATVKAMIDVHDEEVNCK